MKLAKYLICSIFFPLFCVSQNVRHLSVNDGLPQSFVSCLLEDNQGFVWIGTRNGLTRFDGHEFKTLQHIPGDKSSLASNIISKLQKGSNNTLWVLYETNEVDLIDLNTGKVDHVFDVKGVEYSIKGCVIDKENRLWHFFGGEIVYNLELNSSGKSIKENKYVIENDTIWSIFFDRNENLWTLSQKGLNKFNRDLDKFDPIGSPYTISFNEIVDHNGMVDNGISNLYERKNGELVWADKRYIYFFDPNKTAFRRVEMPIGLKSGPKQIQTGPDGKDYFIIEDEIYSYDDVSGITLQGNILSKNRHKEDGFMIQDFLVDQSGLIWIAANTDGVYQADLSLNFETFNYKVDFAISLFDRQFNISLEDYFNFNLKRKGTLLPGYYLRSVNNGNRTWIALNRTVAYCDGNKNKLIKLPEIPLYGPEDFVPIKGITIDSEGNPLVIDQNSYLYYFDLNENHWKTHPSTTLLQNTFNKAIKPSELLVSDGLIWITTEFSGLVCVDEKATKLVHFKKDSAKNSLPTNNLINIIPDVKDKRILWIASYYGLLKFDKDTLESKLFSVSEGLPDNTIYTILQDKNGYLWLGTNRGLCMFNTENFVNRTFALSHGLSTLEYNRYHQLILPNGSFWIGGMNQVILFDPLKIKEDRFNPPIAITGIKLNNNEYKEEKDGFLQYNTFKDLVLPYYKNNLSIEFSALEFSQPEDIRYRYRLNGYDNDWVISNKKREAVYTKIPYGEYSLEINTTNTSGEWCENTKVLPIIISPPWWETKWAIFTYIALCIATVYFFINKSIKQRIIRKEIELKKKEANHFRELNKIKTRFFTNVTHELRTPLSLIIAPVEQLKKTKKKKSRKRLLSIIKKNANSLLNLSDQLLDISKLEAGVLEPSYIKGDIVLSLRKSIEAFREEAKESAIKIELVSPLSAYYIYSPYLLERIMYNLISNSIKYGVEGGRVTVNLLESGSGVTIIVEDNGIGISSKDLPYIFERFYQADLPKDKSNVTGSGIGLSLVSELVKLQNGKINVESEIGENSGTIFTVQLPYEKIKSLGDFKEDNENQDIPVLYENTDLPTILLIEDNKEMLDFLSITLKPYYRIIMSEYATMGLNLAKEIIPDIIISDIMMANMDGLELCKKLKENILTNHIPIILLTAKTELKSRIEGLAVGADDYIVKPFNVSELLLRIRNRIEIQKTQRQVIYEELKLLPNFVEETIQNEKKDDFLIRIDDILEEHLDDEQFGVNDLASNLNMSRTSLHRKIKALTNMTTGKIIQVYRLKRATIFLKENYNISEVSYKTGFGSPSYFTKCFKETYGLTPTEYLENNSLKQ